MAVIRAGEGNHCPRRRSIDRSPIDRRSITDRSIDRLARRHRRKEFSKIEAAGCDRSSGGLSYQLTT